MLQQLFTQLGIDAPINKSVWVGKTITKINEHALNHLAVIQIIINVQWPCIERHTQGYFTSTHNSYQLLSV